MKRYFSLLFIGLIIIGCRPTGTPSHNPTQLHQLSGASTQLVLTQYARQTDTRGTATQNAIDETGITETPTVTPSQLKNNEINVIFRDDFVTALEPGWQWTNENPANWNLSDVPGALRINVLEGYLNLHNASNVLTRPSPTGNFFIETSLLFRPDENNQFAGLVMYESDSDFVQVGLGFCGPVYGCVGRGLYIDIYQNGNLLAPRNAVKFNQDILSIRMVHNQDKITIYTSLDGVVWYRTYEFTTDLNIKRVGLITGQNLITIPEPVTFEYFQIGVFK